ncbi:MAG: hypothetical protein ACRDTG_31930 [Pseudonocardiaceae bacterium]
MTQQPTAGVPGPVHQSARHQIPAVSPPLFPSGAPPWARRPVPEHGEAEEPSPRPRPRRAPLADLVTVITRGSTWQS